MFHEGQNVVLLTAREIVGRMPQFTELRVKERKLSSPRLGWEYQLIHKDHDGVFAHGKWFMEGVLIA